MRAAFLPNVSWAHNVPVRAKLLALFVISTFFLPFSSVVSMGCLAVLAFGLYISVGKQGLVALRTLSPLLYIVAIIIGFHYLNGTLWEGVVAGLRMIGMVLLANFVSITSRMNELMDAVMPLCRPLRLFGLSERRVALAFALMIRFVPVLLAIYSGLQEAYRARSGRRNSWRLIAPFVLRTLKMSESVAEALSARGGADGFR